MTTKVEQYRAAFDLAQQNLDSTNPMDFEISVPTKAKDLELTSQDYPQFSQDARFFRGRLVQLAQQDKLAAEAAAKKAATSPTAPTTPAT